MVSHHQAPVTDHWNAHKQCHVTEIRSTHIKYKFLQRNPGRNFYVGPNLKYIKSTSGTNVQIAQFSSIRGQFQMYTGKRSLAPPPPQKARLLSAGPACDLQGPRCRTPLRNPPHNTDLPSGHQLNSEWRNVFSLT